MSKIKCNQEKCKYNNCEHCMKEGIHVDKDANCLSYEEGQYKPSSKFEFASFERKENSIECNAKECMYNEHQNCMVEHLNIGKKKNCAPCVDYEKRN